MKILAVFVTSIFLFACGTDDADETRETIGTEIADDYNAAMDKAQDVERQMQEQKEKIDQALEDIQ